ncbi:MAG TPA: hypothetical protein VGC90_08980 [Candidatus Limnocylindrales bacterium]
MPRRFLALLAVLGLLLTAVACQGAPAAPALTDPKDILARSVLSLKDVKTVDVKGDLTGSVTVPSSGPFDLKGTTFEVSADIPNKKIHASGSAPALLGTSGDLILLDQTLYYKVAGPLAAMAKADPSGKYTKTDLPAASGGAGDLAANPQKAIDDIKAGLDKLPAPTKAADEKCGNQDCYHVTMKLTDKDVAALDPSSASSLGGTPFTLTIDMWSQKNDLRPAKIVFGIDAGTTGTFGLTLTLTYDQSLSINAPSADQIAP